MGCKNKFFRNQRISSLPYDVDNSNETSRLICKNILSKAEVLSYDGN